MGYTCKFEEFSDYLRVDVTGNWSTGKETKEGKELWTQAANHCNKINIYRVLAVIDIPGSLPVMAAYDIASDPDGLGFTRAVKVAVVYTYEERYKSNQFTENVAVNRGWAVKVFRDEREAKLWLFDD
jgi:hypothetical protein